MHDIEIQTLIDQEKARQLNTINLIASENYVSQDVLDALGSECTNKYAEGYPNARYYGGNEIVDQIELLCQKRARQVFDLTEDWGVNVQPLSGSVGNVSVYMALVPIGGKIMGLSLDQGGHLTHGHSVSATGKIWKQIPYTLHKDTELLDYEQVEKIALEEKPNLIVVGYTAYSRIIDWKKMRDVADACGAYLHVDMSHIAGLVAGGAYPSPFPYADTVMTTTHKTLRGPRSALIFSKKELSSKIDKAVFPGLQGGPHINQIAAVAVALKEAMSLEYKTYIQQVVTNAKTLADELQRLGWRIVSGGTDSHLMLVDTWMNGKGIGGTLASEVLEKNGIIVNKNSIPFDTRVPRDPSGIRLGTAAETTRGKTEKDMIEIAHTIDSILKSIVDGKRIAQSVIDKLKTQNISGKKVCFVQFGNNPASSAFIKRKQKIAEELGVETTVVHEADIDSEDSAVQKMKEIVSEEYDGVIVQLPLPKGIDSKTIVNMIPSKQDIDVLTDELISKYRDDTTQRIPPVAFAVQEILQRHDVDLKDKKVVVLGKGKLVGEPVVDFFKKHTVQVESFDIHADQRVMYDALLSADIVVTGMGQAHMVKAHMIKEGAVLIDAGASEQSGKLVGDCDPVCAQKASVFSTVPGGVGPITVAGIFRNLMVG